MPFFTGGPADYSGGRNQDLSEIKSTFGQSFGASLAEGAEETPVMRLAGAGLRAGLGSLGEPLQPDEANRRYALPGLSFDKPITDALASDLWNDRKTQLLRDQAIASGPRNIFARGANFAGGLLPQFLDPINAASVVVPGLGEEAVGAALVRGAMVADRIGATGAAEGLAGAAGGLADASAALDATRAGRIAKGAASGVVGQAALEPINYELDQSEHRDWSMNQALVNLAFGAVLGGAAGALLPRASVAGRDLAEDAERDAVNAENITSDAHNERFDALTPDQRGSVLNESISAMVEDRPSVAPEVMDRLDPEGSREAAELRASRAPEAPLDHPVTVGHMPEGIEGVPSLPIRLEEGYHSNLKEPGQDRYGRIHIDARHGDQIRRRGYSSIQSYVEDTLANATTIRKGAGKSIFVARMTDDLRRKSGHNSAVLHLIPDPEGYYRVATAGPLRRGTLDDMETLWDRESPAAEPLPPLSPPSEPGAPVETTPVSSDAPDGSRRDGFGGTNSSRASSSVTHDLVSRNVDRLTDAATRAVMDEPADVTAARQAVDRATRDAPELPGSDLDADAAEAERMASEANNQLAALMGDEELTGVDRDISDVFDQAASDLKGDAKAYESVASCLWRNA